MKKVLARELHHEIKLTWNKIPLCVSSMSSDAPYLSMPVPSCQEAVRPIAAGAEPGGRFSRRRLPASASGLEKVDTTKRRDWPALCSGLSRACDGICRGDEPDFVGVTAFERVACCRCRPCRRVVFSRSSSDAAPTPGIECG